MAITETPANKKPSREAYLPVEEAQAIYSSMERFASHTERYGFVYRQTAAMLEKGIISLKWMSHKTMIPCWNGIIRSITEEDEHCQSATVLLEKSLSQWYRQASKSPFPEVHDIRLRMWRAVRRPLLRSVPSSQTTQAAVEQPGLTHGGSSLMDDFNDSLYSTISNVLAVLSAISLLKTSESGVDAGNSNASSLTILHELGLEVCQSLEIASCNSDTLYAPALLLERLRLPLFAAVMSKMVYKKPTEQLLLDQRTEFTSLAGLPTSNEYLGCAGGFLCTIARCYARAKHVDAFHIIQAMVNHLVASSTSKVHDKAIKKFCGRLALAAAFAFSEDTSQPDHLNWALDIELAISGEINSPSKSMLEKTPARGIIQCKNGYRWEEGICEWIA